MPQENSPDSHAAPADIAAPSHLACAVSGSSCTQPLNNQTSPKQGVTSNRVSNGKLGGRPSSLERLGIAREDIWNLAAQGLSNAQISKRLTRSKGRISVRTVATYRSQMPPDYAARFDDFDKMPGVEELRNWINSRYSAAKNSDSMISHLKKIWEACWRKPLESLDENDVMKALSWIKENYPDAQFLWILAIRFMVRAGIGQPAWLTKHLNTKGKKAPPRSLVILNSPEFFDKTLPAMCAEIDKLTYLSQRQMDELRLIFLVKSTTGIRTGLMKEHGKPIERELWGTRLGTGKTSLQIVDGKLVDWIVLGKRLEVWHIRYMPPRIMRMLLGHIAKYHIRQGEPLIQALTTGEALRALAKICKTLGLPHFRLHDFRKVYLTGLCLAGVPLETAVELNVGWLDLNTARKHYLQVKALNADTEYAKMSERFFK